MCIYCELYKQQIEENPLTLAEVPDETREVIDDILVASDAILTVDQSRTRTQGQRENAKVFFTRPRSELSPFLVRVCTGLRQRKSHKQKESDALLVMPFEKQNADKLDHAHSAEGGFPSLVCASFCLGLGGLLGRLKRHRSLTATHLFSASSYS